MDVLAVRDAGRKAARHCRSGNGPYILEMMTYRYRGHSMSDPAKYRTREEVQDVRKHSDPIDHVRELLISRKADMEATLKQVDSEIKVVVNEASEFAMDSPEPEPAELWTDVFA